MNKLMFFVNVLVIYPNSLTIEEHWFASNVPQLNNTDIHNGLQYKLQHSEIAIHNSVAPVEDHQEKMTNVAEVENYGVANDFLHILNLNSTTELPSRESNQQIETSNQNENNTIKGYNLLNRNRKKLIGNSLKMKRKRWKHLRQNQATKRFFDIFHVVEFDNVPCVSSSGLEGTCLHQYECDSTGGVSMGNCADGFGTCCVSLILCDNTSNAATGWVTNPSFPTPNTDRLSCAVTINKASEAVKQFRLDFTTFELQPPNYGTCEEDQFVISGQNINSYIPILCGVNNGLHIYVEVGDVAGPIYLSIQTVSPESRLFAIKVTQLTSSDTLAAPYGCLQYFTERQGTLESFNYGDNSAILLARNPSYLNNMNYAMCIKRSPETCSVTYTNSNIMQIINYDSEGRPILPPGQAGVEIFNCPYDWLLIAAARLCGEKLNDGTILQDFSLNAPVTENAAGPIVIWFKSDGAIAGRGFKLHYEQNSCSPSK